MVNWGKEELAKETKLKGDNGMGVGVGVGMARPPLSRHTQ